MCGAFSVRSRQNQQNKCRVGAHSRNRPSLTHGACCSRLLLFNERFSIQRDEQVFVRCNDHRGRGSVLANDVAGFLAVLLVAGFVDLVAENLEVVHRHLADKLAVLADTAGEHERVDARECHGDAADFAGEPVGERFEGNLFKNIMDEGLEQPLFDNAVGYFRGE